MSFEFDSASAQEVSGNTGKKVLDTGIYDAVIQTVSETVASTGTKGVDISFKIEGAKYPNTIYGIWYEKVNGDKIAFNNAKLNNMVGLAGGKVTAYTKTIEIQGGTKDVTAWKELDGFKCKIVVSKVLDIYQGVKEKNEITAILSEDGKTYAEVLKKSEAKQLAYYTANLHDTHTASYKAYLADGGADDARGTDQSQSQAEESTGSLL